MTRSFKDERIGAVNRNKNGALMKVISYIDTDDIIVQFESGYTVRTRWIYFRKGEVRNVYDRTVHGVGYIGEGPYLLTDSTGEDTPQYTRWRGILLRCYNPNKYPTYEGCTVCKEWHNFQNFAKWYDDNHYEVPGVRMEIDKDILVPGNRVYSPDTCVFAPSDINTHFKAKKANKDLPVGVCFDKSRNKFLASCKTLSGKSQFLGRFTTAEKAAEAYIKFKEDVLAQLAEKYKEAVPPKLYQAMLEYKVKDHD